MDIEDIPDGNDPVKDSPEADEIRARIQSALDDWFSLTSPTIKGRYILGWTAHFTATSQELENNRSAYVDSITPKEQDPAYSLGIMGRCKDSFA